MVLGKFSPNWEDAIIPVNASIRNALESINKSGLMIACAVQQTGQLLGILTDSDIRRALLKGSSLEDPIDRFLNTNPVTAPDDSESEKLHTLTKTRSVREVPLVNSEGKLSDIFVVSLHEKRRNLDDYTSNPIQSRPIENAMFILAGGMGTRLRSIVSDRPKPLAIVGKKPILETLILSAKNQGFKNFFVSVNYMSDQIEAHLDDSKYSNLNIKVIKETSKLGTAGSLGYIQDEIVKPILVANSDLLTTVPFDRIIEYHNQEQADITCVVRPYRVAVPFGVVEIEQEKIKSIKEKPEFVYFVNAGIYVISPTACQLVIRNKPMDMPELVAKAISLNMNVVPFLSHEYWIDVGQPEDFYRANNEYEAIFGDNLK